MFAAFCEYAGDWAIPLLLGGIVLAGCVRRVRIYEAFVEGAAEGFTTALRILPFLVAMMVALSVFRTSGALAACIELLRPALAAIGVPPELAPLAIVRPLSGTGALGVVTEILNFYGPDSLLGYIACTMVASTDTTFYILTVYFGAVGVTRLRYAPLVGLASDLIGFLGSIYVCRRLWE